MVTSKGFDEAKLGINPSQWADFLFVAAEAATVWPTKHHRDMVLKLCEHSKAEICFGLEGQEVALPANLPMAAASSAHAFQMASKCPFSGKSGGQCPVSGQAGPAPANTRSGSTACEHKWQVAPSPPRDGAAHVKDFCGDSRNRE